MEPKRSPIHVMKNLRRCSLFCFGVLALVGSFSLSGCSVCDGASQTEDEVQCAGNILEEEEEKQKQEEQEVVPLPPKNILDLLDNPKNITHPEFIDIPGEGFSIFKTEVTNEQFASFLREKRVEASETADGQTNDCHLEKNKTALCYDFEGEGVPALKNAGGAKIAKKGYVIARSQVNHPVTYVSWYAAKAYCNAKGWELPTESQWQTAAGTGTFPWGNQNPTCARANFDNTNNMGGGASCNSQPVSVESNVDGITATGIYGMAGNVAEWTLTVVPEDNKEEDRKFRVLKGGGWESRAKELENVANTKQLPIVTWYDIGFRCVK